ncbi:MAG: DUF3035 domain-containing protein [Pseudomonadota bacterium]
MDKISVFLGICVLALAGCSGGGSTNGGLSTGPDEFTVEPNRALERPADYVSLPQPTPGASNRADVTPNQDAIVALGGRPAGPGIAQADRAFLAHAQRFGVEPGIRGSLGDGAVRRLFSGRMTLDAYAEYLRFRALGVAVPTAPPRP